MSRLESDLTKLADVRAWLDFKPSNTDHDAQLQRLISACSLFMQRFIERDIYVRTYRHTMAGTNTDMLMVPNYPIRHITSVIVDGSVIPAANISFDKRSIYLDGAYRFSRGRNNVALVYSAGYDPIPQDLAQACLETVALRWRERDRIGQSSKGLAGETTTFSLVDFPPQARSLLNMYKNRVPV